MREAALALRAVAAFLLPSLEGTRTRWGEHNNTR